MFHKKAIGLVAVKSSSGREVVYVYRKPTDRSYVPTSVSGEKSTSDPADRERGVCRSSMPKTVEKQSGAVKAEHPPMTRNIHKPRAVFDYVATSETVWRDRKTGTRLAPGAVQNWPTREMEKWIDHQYKVIAEAKKKPAFVDLSDVKM